MMKTVSPQKEHGIVCRMTDGFFTCHGWPTVARDEDGRLYVAASGFRASHLSPAGKTVLYTSLNEGATWSPPIVLNDTYLDDRDGGLLYLGEGRLLISWFTLPLSFYDEYYPNVTVMADPVDAMLNIGFLNAMRTLPKEETRGGSYLRISEDYGTTWGKRVRLPISAPHGPARLADGTIAYLGLEYCGEDELPHHAVALYASTDGGKTFTLRGTVTPPDWLADGEYLDEPHVIELPDGTLLGAFRIEGRVPFTIGTSRSEDGGYTWSPVECLGVSGSPPHLMLHSSGSLICSFGRREPPYGERAIVSTDGGRTWDTEYILNDEGITYDLGYPSTVELSDGSLLTVYYQALPGDKQTSLLYTKWRLEARA